MKHTGFEIVRVIQRKLHGDVTLVKCAHSGSSYIIKSESKDLLHTSNSSTEYNHEFAVLHRSRCDPHPNVVALSKESEQLKWCPVNRYMTMPYYKGGDLLEAIKAKHILGDNLQTRKVCQGIAEGVYHLHNNLLYAHNDISPENVVLTALGVPLICDFEQSLPLGTFWKPERRFSGKLNYQAPEVFHCRKKYSCSASDVYSMGVTFFAILTGLLPFDYPDVKLDKRYMHVQNGRMDELLRMWDVKISKDAIDLMTYMLIDDPLQRKDLDYILKHPWLQHVQ